VGFGVGGVVLCGLSAGPGGASRFSLWTSLKILRTPPGPADRPQSRTASRRKTTCPIIKSTSQKPLQAINRMSRISGCGFFVSRCFLVGVVGFLGASQSVRSQDGEGRSALRCITTRGRDAPPPSNPTTPTKNRTKQEKKRARLTMHTPK